MQTLGPKTVQLFRFRAVGMIIPLLFILYGCSSTTANFRWVNPELVDFTTNPSSLNRNVRDDWAKRIADLPIELHANLPSQSNSDAAAIINNVIPDDIASSPEQSAIINSKKQRVVLYIDGTVVPERQDFCVLDKKMRTLPDEHKSITLRGAVCDGSKIVAYASESEGLADLQASNLGERTNHLKKSLVAALYPGPTLKEAFAVGGPAGW